MLELPDVLDKGFLVCHTGVLAIAKDTDIPQPELHEALVDKIHRGVYVKSYRRLRDYQQSLSQHGS